MGQSYSVSGLIPSSLGILLTKDISAVNPVTKQAAAIGYHTQILLPFGGSVWYQISVPYSSVVASQFSGIDWNKFTWHAHDSYTF